MLFAVDVTIKGRSPWFITNRCSASQEGTIAFQDCCAGRIFCLSLRVPIVYRSCLSDSFILAPSEARNYYKNVSLRARRDFIVYCQCFPRFFCCFLCLIYSTSGWVVSRYNDRETRFSCIQRCSEYIFDNNDHNTDVGCETHNVPLFIVQVSVVLLPWLKTTLTSYPGN